MKENKTIQPKLIQLALIISLAFSLIYNTTSIRAIKKEQTNIKENLAETHKNDITSTRNLFISEINKTKESIRETILEQGHHTLILNSEPLNQQELFSAIDKSIKYKNSFPLVIMSEGEIRSVKLGTLSGFIKSERDFDLAQKIMNQIARENGVILVAESTILNTPSSSIDYTQIILESFMENKH